MIVEVEDERVPAPQIGLNVPPVTNSDGLWKSAPLIVKLSASARRDLEERKRELTDYINLWESTYF